MKDRDIEKKFKKYGRIVDYKIVMDPILRESRGFGFVTYETKAEASEAVKEMDGYDMEGKEIVVQIARRSRPRKSTPGRYLGYDKSRVRNRSRWVSPFTRNFTTINLDFEEMDPFAPHRNSLTAERK